MIDKISVNELSRWREVRATEVLIKELARRKVEREQQLVRASVDGTIETIRKIAGALEEIDYITRLVNTEGVADAGGR